MHFDRNAILLTGLFVLSFGLHQLGTAISIPWGSEPVPRSEVLASIELGKAFAIDGSSETFRVFAFGLVLLLGYLIFRGTGSRLALLGLAVVAPMLQIEPVFGCVMFLCPWIFWSALTGQADGEFYQEHMHLAGAVGLWMLSCFLLGIWQGIRAFSTKRRHAGLPDGSGEPITVDR